MKHRHMFYRCDVTDKDTQYWADNISVGVNEFEYTEIRCKNVMDRWMCSFNELNIHGFGDTKEEAKMNLVLALGKSGYKYGYRW